MKIYPMLAIFALAACGTIGIGSNHTVSILNESADVITVTGERGTQRIQAGATTDVTSRRTVSITSANAKCDSPNIVPELNTPALVFNIFPGLLLGIIPLFVDAITGNLTRMPESYTFMCAAAPVK
ncbi:MAG: hypothetical protein FWC61_02310 [Proteobacteria bacterium]|nr:hypothetical protein [Pseudomonadota bacterium]